MAETRREGQLSGLLMALAEQGRPAESHAVNLPNAQMQHFRITWPEGSGFDFSS